MAFGVSLFAGVLLATLASFTILQGLAAVLKDDVFVRGVNYTFQFDVTTWGWIHLLLGIVVAAAGLGLAVGQMWARVVGIVVALVSAIVNLAFIAAYPVWGAIIITVDILVIYALTVHGKETKASEYTDYA